MILADYHVHSDFSTDSDASMEEQLKAAAALGLNRLCFTDHMDFDYPERYGGGFQLDPKPYCDRAAALKAGVKPGGVLPLLGIEVGMQPEYAGEGQRLVSEYPFDFVLCSSHLADGRDPYYPDYWEHYASEREGILGYFEAIYENLDVFSDFDVYGHLDYIFRYAPSLQKNSPAGEPDGSGWIRRGCEEIVDEILKRIILLGKGIEVNSAGYRYGLGHAHPHETIIRRYLELGGEILTVGSDSHKPEHVGFAFDKTRAMLLALGVRYYAIFEARRPSLSRL